MTFFVIVLGGKNAIGIDVCVKETSYLYFHMYTCIMHYAV